jgi:hypothetical protein
MRISIALLFVVVLMWGVASSVGAYSVSYDFNTAWAGDYAPGWENTAYRHGAAPVGRMMEYVAGGRDGTTGMRLIASSTPESWMWWAAVNPTSLNQVALEKQYDPWVSVWYYDRGWENGSLHQAGQLFSVPSWTNLYIPSDPPGGPNEDWTDVQFGARVSVEYTSPPNDNYYYVCAGEDCPGWVDTGVDRLAGDNWVNLKMQLSSVDGKIHFYVRRDEAAPFVEVGVSNRDDYVDLGAESGLYTMFTDPLSSWTQNKPSTIWDDFEVGSTYNPEVPEPMSIMLGILGLGSIAGFRKLRRS